MLRKTSLARMHLRMPQEHYLHSNIEHTHQKQQERALEMCLPLPTQLVGHSGP